MFLLPVASFSVMIETDIPGIDGDILLDGRYSSIAARDIGTTEESGQRVEALGRDSDEFGKEVLVRVVPVLRRAGLVRIKIGSNIFEDEIPVEVCGVSQ